MEYYRYVSGCTKYANVVPRHKSVPEQHGLVSGVNDSMATAKIDKLAKQFLVFRVKAWKDLQFLPQLNAAIAKLSLGLAKRGLIDLGSNSRIHEKIAIGKFLFNFVQLLGSCGT